MKRADYVSLLRFNSAVAKDDSWLDMQGDHYPLWRTLLNPFFSVMFLKNKLFSETYTAAESQVNRLIVSFYYTVWFPEHLLH